MNHTQYTLTILLSLMGLCALHAGEAAERKKTPAYQLTQYVFRKIRSIDPAASLECYGAKKDFWRHPVLLTINHSLSANPEKLNSIRAVARNAANDTWKLQHIAEHASDFYNHIVMAFSHIDESKNLNAQEHSEDDAKRAIWQAFGADAYTLVEKALDAVSNIDPAAQFKYYANKKLIGITYNPQYTKDDIIDAVNICDYSWELTYTARLFTKPELFFSLYRLDPWHGQWQGRKASADNIRRLAQVIYKRHGKDGTLLFGKIVETLFKMDLRAVFTFSPKSLRFGSCDLIYIHHAPSILSANIEYELKATNESNNRIRAMLSQLPCYAGSTALELRQVNNVQEALQSCDIANINKDYGSRGTILAHKAAAAVLAVDPTALFAYQTKLNNPSGYLDIAYSWDTFKPYIAQAATLEHNGLKLINGEEYTVGGIPEIRCRFETLSNESK